MSTLYIVATPIGNLKDITFRAIEVLKSVNIILCEDTRETKKLLSHYDINQPTLSFHSHSGESKYDKILELLKEGKNLALVTDAGTPGISDPGVALVAFIRENCKTEISGGEIKIGVIPGASAITSALSIAGIPSDEFTFIGFLPHKKGRETKINEMLSSDRTYVFYESPHRIMKTLQSLREKSDKLCIKEGNDSIMNRKVAIARELTKVFEQFISGTPEEVYNYFVNNSDKVKGEFVVMVYTLV
jgi:16S rRNA (cytidine1402-2'-O)-methyltransferase